MVACLMTFFQAAGSELQIIFSILQLKCLPNGAMILIQAGTNMTKRSYHNRYRLGPSSRRRHQQAPNASADATGTLTRPFKETMESTTIRVLCSAPQVTHVRDCV
jgi:hypothetical protein